MIRRIDEKVKKYCARKYLKKNNLLEIRENSHREYIYLDEPLLFARLAGQIKNSLGAQVFMRGQPRDYLGMKPSLFRGNINSQVQFYDRLQAYRSLVKQLPSIFPNEESKRFRGEIGGAILQHYGLSTPWLDLVDNIFVALWFACWERTGTNEKFNYQKNQEGDGWVYFLKFDGKHSHTKGIVTGTKSKWCDLRISKTSLVLRAHVQHGILGMAKDLEFKNCDLDNLVVASINFPTKKFAPLLSSFAPSFMFPSDKFDNTYKILHQYKPKIDLLIRDSEKSNELKTRILGVIDKFGDE